MIKLAYLVYKKWKCEKRNERRKTIVIKRFCLHFPKAKLIEIIVQLQHIVDVHFHCWRTKFRFDLGLWPIETVNVNMPLKHHVAKNEIVNWLEGNYLAKHRAVTTESLLRLKVFRDFAITLSVPSVLAVAFAPFRLEFEVAGVVLTN